MSQKTQTTSVTHFCSSALNNVSCRLCVILLRVSVHNQSSGLTRTQGLLCSCRPYSHISTAPDETIFPIMSCLDIGNLDDETDLQAFLALCMSCKSLKHTLPRFPANIKLRGRWKAHMLTGAHPLFASHLAALDALYKLCSKISIWFQNMRCFHRL